MRSPLRAATALLLGLALAIPGLFAGENQGLPPAIYAQAIMRAPQGSFSQIGNTPLEILTWTPTPVRIRAGFIAELLDIDDDYDLILPFLVPERPLAVLYGEAIFDRETAMALIVEPGSDIVEPALDVANARRVGDVIAIDDDPRRGIGPNARWIPSRTLGDGTLVLTGDDGDTEFFSFVRFDDKRWLVIETRDPKKGRLFRNALEAGHWTFPELSQNVTMIIEIEPAKAAALLEDGGDDTIEDWAEAVFEYAGGPVAALAKHDDAPGPGTARFRKHWESDFRQLMANTATWRLEARIADKGLVWTERATTRP